LGILGPIGRADFVGEVSLAEITVDLIQERIMKILAAACPRTYAFGG
jgi:hypothetical protein